MNCRSFRKLHVTYVDGLLDERQSVKMDAHLDECERCARWNTAIRRGLLVARNLPTIQPSPDFMARLQVRLATPDASSGTPPTIPARTGYQKLAVRTAVAVAIAVSAVIMVRANRAPAVPLAVPAPVTVAQSKTATSRHNGSALSEPELARMLATVVPVWIPADPSSEHSTVQLVSAGLQAPSLSP